MKPRYRSNIEYDMARYRDQKIALSHLPERIATLESEFSALRAARVDGEPVKGGTNRREEALVNNIDLRTRLERNLRIAMENVSRIDRAIGELDEAEQIVFCGYYLDFKSVDWLAEELGLKKSQTYQIKEDAERRFVTMEYGVIE